MSGHTFLFSCAGEAGTGIADLIAHAIPIECNAYMEEGRQKTFPVNSGGLVTKKRLEAGELQCYKTPYAHDVSVWNVQICGQH